MSNLTTEKAEAVENELGEPVCNKDMQSFYKICDFIMDNDLYYDSPATIANMIRKELCSLPGSKK